MLKVFINNIHRYIILTVTFATEDGMYTLCHMHVQPNAITFVNVTTQNTDVLLYIL